MSPRPVQDSLIIGAADRMSAVTGNHAPRGPSTAARTASVEGGRVLRGTLRVPGDKSVSHRALILALLARGTSTIEGLSAGLDVAHTRAIVEALGARITEAPDAGSAHRVGTLTVEGGDLHEAAHVLDVGNSGTGIRLLAGLCAGMPFRSVLQGDESIAQRPMDRVTIPLRLMGARIDGRDGGRLAPLVIDGGGLHGIDYTPPVASAQVKSAVLLAGLLAEGVTVVREPVPTRRHTEEMLRDRGVDVVTEAVGEGGDVITLRPGPLKAGAIVVPGDPSQAAFWICGAAAIPGSDLTVEGLYLGPERTGFLPVLQRMGADLTIDRAAGSVRVRGSELHGTVVPRRGAAGPHRRGARAGGRSSTRGRGGARRAGRSRAAHQGDRPDRDGGRDAACTRGDGRHRARTTRGAQRCGAPPRRGRVRGRPSHRHGRRDRRARRTCSRGWCGRRGQARSPYGSRGWDAVATSYPGFLDDLAAVAVRP